jgi:hypothetical protein
VPDLACISRDNGPNTQIVDPCPDDHGRLQPQAPSKSAKCDP